MNYSIFILLLCVSLFVGIELLFNYYYFYFLFIMIYFSNYYYFFIIFLQTMPGAVLAVVPRGGRGEEFLISVGVAGGVRGGEEPLARYS